MEQHTWNRTPLPFYLLTLAGAQIEEMWKDTTSSMKKIGVGIGVVDRNRNPRLSDTLGVRHVPSIIGVVNGYVSFYSGLITKEGLKEFVTGLFPSGLIETVSVLRSGGNVICQTNLLLTITMKSSATYFSISLSIFTIKQVIRHCCYPVSFHTLCYSLWTINSCSTNL